MRALARWCIAHRRFVIVAWVVLLVGANVVGQAVGSTYNSNYKGQSTSGSQRAIDLLQQSFPVRKGDSASIVFDSTASVASRAGAWRDRLPARADRALPARERRRHALLIGRQCGLPRRPHRLRHGAVRRALFPAPDLRDQPRHQHRHGGADALAPGPARRPADRAGRATEDGAGDVGRHPRGDHHPADHLRHGGRRGPAAAHGAARAGHRDRADRPADARLRRRQLHPRAGGDDRAWRRHRLRALPRDALPLRARRRGGARRGDRHGDGHLGPRRALRRRRRRDRDARPAARRRQLPARSGRRVVADGAPDDARGDHAAPGGALEARPRHRPLGPVRASPPRAPPRRRASGSAGPR